METGKIILIVFLSLLTVLLITFIIQVIYFVNKRKEEESPKYQAARQKAWIKSYDKMMASNTPAPYPSLSNWTG
jgi:flagellar basal body-associated protein FliL